MSMSVREAHTASVALIDALADDLKAISRASYELERLVNMPGEWSAADYATFAQQTQVVTELLKRYRVSEARLAVVVAAAAGRPPQMDLVGHLLAVAAVEGRGKRRRKRR